MTSDSGFLYALSSIKEAKLTHSHIKMSHSLINLKLELHFAYF